MHYPEETEPAHAMVDDRPSARPRRVQGHHHRTAHLADLPADLPQRQVAAGNAADAGEMQAA